MYIGHPLPRPPTLMNGLTMKRVDDIIVVDAGHYGESKRHCVDSGSTVQDLSLHNHSRNSTQPLQHGFELLSQAAYMTSSSYNSSRRYDTCSLPTKRQLTAENGHDPSDIHCCSIDIGSPSRRIRKEENTSLNEQKSEYFRPYCIDLSCQPHGALQSQLLSMNDHAWIPDLLQFTNKLASLDTFHLRQLERELHCQKESITSVLKIIQHQLSLASQDNQSQDDSSEQYTHSTPCLDNDSFDEPSSEESTDNNFSTHSMNE